jgi:hypothetical protein
VTGGRGDDAHPEADAGRPWHHSTVKVLGASVAALAAIVLIVGGVLFVSRQAGETPQAPLNFVEPSFSKTSDTASSEPSTTSATGRPSPPQTTDIDLPPTSVPPPPPPPSSAESSTSTRRPTTRNNDDEDEDDSSPTSTRKRPRLNETRLPSN